MLHRRCTSIAEEPESGETSLPEGKRGRLISVATVGLSLRKSLLYFRGIARKSHRLTNKVVVDGTLN